MMITPPRLIHPSFSFSPTLPLDRPAGAEFLQTISLHSATEELIGHIRWHVADPATGVVQILELKVAATYRRRGFGTALLQSMLVQVRQYFSDQQQHPRRIWANVRQKEQVISRAFFTARGFHHISSIGNLFPAQEGLIYVLGLD